MIVHVSASTEGESFAEYVDRLLAGLGESNSSASRRTGIHVSLISKWRLGQTLPSIDRARQFADGMKVPRLVVMIKAGLLEPEDVQLDPLYLELVELDGITQATDEGAHRTLRDHLGLLIEGTRSKLDRLRAARPGTGRKAS